MIFSVRPLVSILVCLFFAAKLPVAAIVTSQLWGVRGESWQAGGRLPDFSYAGYHRGEEAPPIVEQAANVKDFGAVGDGNADDTCAIQAAIDATARGAIYFPEGRYRVTDFIHIKKSGIVLRGAGPLKSVLEFPRGLDEIHPKTGRTATGSPASGYSFDGAFVTIKGSYKVRPLTPIMATAARGATTVEVDSTDMLAVGQTVLVAVREDTKQSLKMYLYNGDAGDIARGKPFETRMVMRVAALDGKRVTFDRPLRVETRPEWRPEIRSFEPTVTESGIEELGFVFPATTYRGHFKENGANAIELSGVYHCWVRNVVIHNADLGINLKGCHNTIDGVVITASAERAMAAGTRDAGCAGHHAIQCKAAEDNLITRFDLQTHFIHDLSVEHASGNVFASGRGADLSFDHHKDTPYENLFTDIDVGAGKRVWVSGGGPSLGRHAAGWATFWCIRASNAFELPPAGWGVPTMNLVALAAGPKPGTAVGEGIWWETFPPEQLQPASLHAAQLAFRLTSLKQETPKTAAASDK
jgi:hypothetical protein